MRNSFGEVKLIDIVERHLVSVPSTYYQLLTH